MMTVNLEPVFRKEKLDLFWRFICERQNIWHRRFVQKLNPPWSNDKLLQIERITNIYRELDPGTQYAINEMLEKDAPKADKVFNIMIYRLIGRSDTHKRLGFQKLNTFDPYYLEKTLKQIENEGKSPFTGAYMVSGYSQMGSKNKAENIAKLFGKVHEEFESTYKRITDQHTSEGVYEVFKSLYGFGNFLAYQILVDLRYPLKRYGGKPLLPYSNDEWVAAGPGAKRGIKMLLKNEVKVDSLELMHWLRDNQETEFKRLGLSFKYLKDNAGKDIRLSLANIQGCLCEFHKYVKIMEKTGRGRRKFSPVTNASFYNNFSGV